jgi:hypothetical protein
MSTSDPVLYPQPVGSVEAMRQETARARADLARSIELLSERLTPRRLLRPSVPVVAGTVAGVAVWATLFRYRMLRKVAWLGGLAAAVVAFAGARRIAAPPPIVASPRPPAARPTGMDDAVDVLLSQHRDIVHAFDAVRDSAPGQDRLERFAVLVELLRRHERVEQHVVHPVMAGFADGVARERVDEEQAADRMLASLISAGVDHQAFAAGLARLRRMVRDHADQEERLEFPVLRERLSAERLHDLTGQIVRTP